jgi:hypothetical protein
LCFGNQLFLLVKSACFCSQILIFVRWIPIFAFFMVQSQILLMKFPVFLVKSWIWLVKSTIYLPLANQHLETKRTRFLLNFHRPAWSIWRSCEWLYDGMIYPCVCLYLYHVVSIFLTLWFLCYLALSIYLTGDTGDSLYCVNQKSALHGGWHDGIGDMLLVLKKCSNSCKYVPQRTSAMIGDASHNHPKVWILHKFKNIYIDINIDLNINE